MQEDIDYIKTTLASLVEAVAALSAKPEPEPEVMQEEKPKEDEEFKTELEKVKAELTEKSKEIETLNAKFSALGAPTGSAFFKSEEQALTLEDKLKGLTFVEQLKLIRQSKTK